MTEYTNIALRLVYIFYRVLKTLFNHKKYLKTAWESILTFKYFFLLVKLDVVELCRGTLINRESLPTAWEFSASFVLGYLF